MVDTKFLRIEEHQRQLIHLQALSNGKRANLHIEWEQCSLSFETKRLKFDTNQEEQKHKQEK